MTIAKIRRKKGPRPKGGGSASTFLLLAVFFAGTALLLYPTVSDWWNSFHQTRAIASYTEAVANINAEEYDYILSQAQAWNETLATRGGTPVLTAAEEEQYKQTLSLSNDGIIGYIEIQSIRCELPIYHGVDESILQVAVGHLPWSSLPVGGEGTHCVLSGHRGLPSAKLFTDLDRLREGDVFTLRVLNETLTYEVDQIRTVLPEELNDLQPVPGEDLCTLVTCTPYGINTHRLLVRGHRIANILDGSRVSSEAWQVEPVLVAPFIALPILGVLVLFLMIKYRKKH